jgi:hypothetical protein
MIGDEGPNLAYPSGSQVPPGAPRHARSPEFGGTVGCTEAAESGSGEGALLELGLSETAFDADAYAALVWGSTERDTAA